MESINFGGLLAVLGTFGPYGLLLLLWYLESKAQRKASDEHKKEMANVLQRYSNDMREQRLMYENNVVLVKSWQSVAKDLKDIVVLNTRCLTQLSEEIKQNQYCPAVRLEKKTVTLGGLSDD